jgi:cyanophycinase
MMLNLESQSLRIRMPQSTKTAILVIGGAEDKVHGREILQTFVYRSGATDARIAIVPSASREPAAIGDRYSQIFQELGAQTVKVLDIREREHCENEELQEFVRECTGVFLTGGDQLRLWGLLADTPLMEKVRRRVKAGEITLAGTSAGAAVMGDLMIAGGGSGECPNRSLVDMATGLGIIPEVIVDQHFHNRNRMSRLMSAVAAHPDKLGIGIDEDTCALFERDGVLQAIGKGTITIVDPADVSYTNHDRIAATDPISIHNLRVHVLSYGHRYHLHQRTILPSER